MKKIVIIGAGGFGREVLDIFDACNLVNEQYDVLGYIVQEEYGKPNEIINDKLVLGGFDWLEKYAKEVHTICAVGSPQHRRRLVNEAYSVGAQFCSIVHPTTTMTRWVSIGEGVIITAGCILTNQIKIGNHAQINLDCTIGHDVFIKDYSTIAPGVHISGNVTLGEGCYIGTGVNIIEKLIVGEWAIVGAGSTITKNVPENTTVVGVPGVVIKTRKTGWHLE